VEKIEVFCKGNGRVKRKGFTSFCYQGEEFIGVLQKDRFIGNAKNGQSCLLWQVMRDRTNFFNISTSVIWRVVEVRMPLSSRVEKDVFLLPLVSKTSVFETRRLEDIMVTKRKGKRMILQAKGRHALWLFNALHRWYGPDWELYIADTFFSGFVDAHC
jgi:hypothetical protein